MKRLFVFLFTTIILTLSLSFASFANELINDSCVEIQPIYGWNDYNSGNSSATIYPIPDYNYGYEIVTRYPSPGLNITVGTNGFWGDNLPSFENTAEFYINGVRYVLTVTPEGEFVYVPVYDSEPSFFEANYTWLIAIAASVLFVIIICIFMYKRISKKKQTINNAIVTELDDDSDIW